MERFFAVCAPGLEPFTALELSHLGLINKKPFQHEDFPPESSHLFEPGGVPFRGNLHDLYRANLYLRTASRVLVRLGEFYASVFPELRRKASLLPWEKYLRQERPIALRVTCQKSRLYHEGGVAERISGAIDDRLGNSPSLQRYHEDSDTNLPQLIVVRLTDNLCTISIDSSGALLHKRGYRLAVTKAPLRETVASAMVMASGWDLKSPLLDPFCGSGTIPIEAALLARKVPAGYFRTFAFMDWPNFDSGYWDKLTADAGKAIVSTPLKIIASDRDAGAIRSAQANAGRADVADCIEFSCKAISAIDPPSIPGWIITNPPYGVRLSKHADLRNLYAQFGKVLHIRCSGWHVTMLCDNIRLIHATGLEFDRGIPMVNGGLKVKLVRASIRKYLQAP